MNDELNTILERTVADMDRVRREHRAGLRVEEVGRIVSVGEGIASLRGLEQIRLHELIRFPGDTLGIAFNLDPQQVAAILLDDSPEIQAGREAYRTGRVMDVPVGEGLLGRLVDPMGRPLDERGPVQEAGRYPIERRAPAILDRLPVTEPLQTGLMAVDALIPIGRGQRELILGDRQTGKTAIAVDTIINQRDKGVLCIYCSIGKESTAVAKVIQDLKRFDAMENTVVVVATGEDTPAKNYVAPYAAMAMGEYFMDQGRDALVIFDDLTRHARSYRELSLLLRRPPAREAYPGDIFYVHSRLLERSTHMKEEFGGGSLTALPIIETQAQNLSAYIPTNLISITDGQIYLSPKLFQEAVLPPVDVGRSVSRVGGKTQLPAYRMVAGDLRLSYTQYQELESFARFGVQLDEETRRTLERGRRVREVLKQPQYSPIPVPQQIAVLLAVTSGLFDRVPVDRIEQAKGVVRRTMEDRLPDPGRRLLQGEKLSDEETGRIVDTLREALAQEMPELFGKEPAEKSPEGR